MRCDEVGWKALYLEDEVVAFVSAYKLLADDIRPNMYKKCVHLSNILLGCYYSQDLQSLLLLLLNELCSLPSNALSSLLRLKAFLVPSLSICAQLHFS